MFDNTRRIIELNKKKGNMVYAYSLEREMERLEKEAFKEMEKEIKDMYL